MDAAMVGFAYIVRDNAEDTQERQEYRGQIESDNCSSCLWRAGAETVEDLIANASTVATSCSAIDAGLQM